MPKAAEKTPDPLNVAVVQMTSVNHRETNEATVRRALEDIEKKSAETQIDLVVFPENVWFLRLVDGEQATAR